MVSLNEGAEVTVAENNVAKNTVAVAEVVDVEAQLARQFKLLGDATRLRILGYLRDDAELHVSALQERLGQSQPAVSHHLGLLREAGIVSVRRDGKHNFYSLNEQNVDVLAEQLMTTLGRELPNNTPEIVPAISAPFNSRENRETLLTTAP